MLTIFLSFLYIHGIHGILYNVVNVVNADGLIQNCTIVDYSCSVHLRHSV